MNDQNQLYNSKMHEAEINPELQKKINTPPIDPEGFNSDDEGFLQEIIAKVQAETINLYSVSSLYNEKLVEKLSPESQTRVEFAAQNLLSDIREIVTLWEYEKKPTYQIKNLIHHLRVTKERLELKEGDVFII
ncbi:hypothetical protein KKG71_04510 [Patescibacteria group bacterium]|nr:hypothetical protein [Patescibacteria group bacterium]